MKTTPYHRQQGIVLIVAMIMLVIMSILGISSVRTVALEEKMSAAALDYNIALQAAEAALIAGQQDARNRTGGITPDPGATATDCPGGNAVAPSNGYVSTIYRCADNWMAGKDSTWWSANSRLLANSNSGANLGPLAGNNTRYLIEYRGTQICKPKSGEIADKGACLSKNPDPSCSCYLFRITARANPANGRADVMLQTLFTTY